MKYLKPLGLTIVMLAMLVGLSPYPADAGIENDPPAPVQTSVDAATQTNLYLPCVNSGFCALEVPSPFSIQIAGLSDFTPPPGMTKAQIDQLRQQEYAELTAVFPTLVEALRDSGAGSARVYIDWSYIQSVDAASYNWTMYDSWISQVAAAGVDMIGTVSNPPDWAVDTAADPCTNKIEANHIPDFTQFLTTLVNRYKDAPYGIHTWEVLNEPDAIDGYRCTTGISNYGEHGADYAALLQEAYPAIKAADPSAKVIMGGLAYDWFHLDYDRYRLL